MAERKIISVCILVSNLDASTGGVQKNTRLLSSEFTKRSIETFICTRNYHDLPTNETVNGVHIHRTRIVGKSVWMNSILYLVDTFFWLILNRSKYDVIHCQQIYGPTMVAAVSSLITGKPILTRITLSGETGEANTVRKMPLWRIRRRLINFVSKFVVLTSEMKGEIAELGISPNKIEIIYNATEIPSESAYDGDTRARYKTVLNLDQEKIVVFTGRLSHEKGLDILIEAWTKVRKKHQNAHLLLLGEGGDFRNVEVEMRKMVVDLEILDSVHFLGHVPNPKDYILASDLFVLPSRAEGMSNSLVEAMACGAVIVTSNIPAMVELCESGRNALTVKVESVSELSEAMIRLLNDPAVALGLAREAKQKAYNDLSVETMIDRYVGCYNAIMNR